MPELMNTIMADGPSSNPSQPVKALLRAWGTWVESIITAFLSNGGLIYDTKAHMDADLAHGANSSAWVVGDATVANNGIYRKLGASGVGSWTRVADLPYSFIAATDAGAGTANAIVATTSIPLPSANGAALISLNIFENNTGPATVSFNGGAALAIKTNAGNDVQANYLVAGMIVAGYVSGSTFRLISEIGTAADRAAAEAAAAAAAASAASINLPAISVADAGKTLFINAAGDGYDVDEINADRVTQTSTDELRITIGNLAYPAKYGTYDPTGVALSTAALQAAVNSKKYVEVGEGTFKIDATIALRSGSKLIGYGRGTSKINIASTTLPAITLPSAGIEIDIKDLSITRTGTPVAGAHGILCVDAVSLCKLNNLYVQGHYNGLHLRTTGYSEAADIITTNNLNNGLYMQNTAGQNAIQWYLDRILAQVNGNHGLYAEALNGGGTQVALGDWANIRSFANSGAGVAVKGYVGAEVNALRLRGGFLGEDGLACIFLDSRGFGHKIENMFLEIAGTRTTGPNLTTPATGTAPGIQINVNEQDVKVADCYVSGNSAHGIVSNVTTLLRVATTTFKSNTGFGVVAADGAKYAETGCDFITNTTGARSFTANSQSALIVGSTPATTSPTQIPGGVAVGAPTGGTPSAGLINVSAGLLKNNTAYTNP
ncbi:hypothetical protein [Mesorhizobium sp. B1-1-6]|uniref:hypothetical protein n=1 Tax=Mesorhizobium sp. B1-1-6 TaxID=2589978 RepID=UPI00112ECDF2|nr:hypothetical protein [Mesorhizobium sp. B1-1-6]TPN34806.1 hypothetical protein FJ979_21715 [Mesorhizobium sp. B1-1-6]